MHWGGFELTKLTYTRLEYNLIRHRDDRGAHRSTSTNECDHNGKYTYFIIARSFARPPSLLLLLCPMVMGMTLCFEVMNSAVVHV